MFTRRLRTAIVTLFLASAVVLSAEPVPVHHLEGLVHGFLSLRSPEGRLIASGDLIQNMRDDRVTSRLVFHFKDGSLSDETTVFSERRLSVVAWRGEEAHELDVEGERDVSGARLFITTDRPVYRPGQLVSRVDPE